MLCGVNQAAHGGYSSLLCSCFYSDDHQEGEGAELDILMEAPEGFRNSDEDCCYLSQVKTTG